MATHKRYNKRYQAFAEVGRVIQTIFLLELLSSLELRQDIRVATTLDERYNGFLSWLALAVT